MGFYGIFKHFSGFEFFLLSSRVHVYTQVNVKPLASLYKM
jgi:hypothetical protein